MAHNLPTQTCGKEEAKPAAAAESVEAQGSRSTQQLSSSLFGVYGLGFGVVGFKVIGPEEGVRLHPPFDLVPP